MHVHICYMFKLTTLDLSKISCGCSNLHNLVNKFSNSHHWVGRISRTVRICEHSCLENLKCLKRMANQST